ncbi:MAG TPA: PA14 domain-containing protein [Polyangia bacterium]|nr:PA14 domain-containing protein [Polyangia bacterium]
MGGADIQFGNRTGAQISRVTVNGTTPTSLTENHVMAINAATSGHGTYISVSGGSAVGHYAVAHMENAAGVEISGETLDLYISSIQPDLSSNLFHDASMRSNADVWLYTVYAFHPMNRQWVSICPIDPRTGAASAIAIAEDPATDPNRFVFACTLTGVASKCARNWGYKPWRSDAVGWTFNTATNQWVQGTQNLKPFYDACKIAARAAYCQDPQGFTKNGTTVDLYDNRGLIWSNNAENPASQLMFAQEFSVAVAPDARVSDQLTSDFMSHLPSEQQTLVTKLTSTGLQRTRYRDIAPQPGECQAYPWIDRLEKDLFEDARWMSFVNDRARVVVLTPTYCGHSDQDIGGALAWDCNRCTARVCKDIPACCDANGGAWTQACVNKRHEVCLPDPAHVESSSNPVFPRGIAIPAIADTGSPLTFSTGPIGAVESVELYDIPGQGTVTRVRGWACDPSAAAVHSRVRIYQDAPPGEAGSIDLSGQFTLADQPADPLYAEPIRRACGDPSGGPVRRMFDVWLEGNSTPTVRKPFAGKIFVYAEDLLAKTPATLLRNGIRRIGACAHGEYSTGAKLDSSCSACAAKVCAAPGMGYCCTSTWDGGCVQVAGGSGDALDPSFNQYACTAAESSATVHPETFSVVRTGWVEPPITGDYIFYAHADDAARLWVNGQLLIDRWTVAPGKYASPSVRLLAGVKYHIRWDFFDGPFLAENELTWATPVTVSDVPVPPTSIYNLSPGRGNGLDAQYFNDVGLVSPAQARKDPSIDFTSLPPPPVVPYPDPYSAKWTGLVMAPATDAYKFVVIDDGDATLKIDGVTVIAGGTPPVGGALAPGCMVPEAGGHDICATGAKLLASCHACATTICNVDPYCCQGGYLSPYASEPTWDAKCVAQVATLCGSACPAEPVPGRRTRVSAPISLKSGVKHEIELVHQHASAAKESLQLLWESPRLPRAVVAQDYLFSQAAPENAGSGFNAIYYNNNDNNGVITPDLSNPSDSRHEQTFQLGPTETGPEQTPTGTPLASLSSPLDWVPAAPTLVSPQNGATLSSLNVEIHGYGVQSNEAGTIARVEVFNETLGTTTQVPGAVTGEFSTTLPLVNYGPYVVKVRSRYQFCGSGPCQILFSPYTTVSFTVQAFSASNKPPAPVVSDPKDPTHMQANLVRVAGAGSPGGTITVTDEATSAQVGQFPANASAGLFDTNITLADGWHKLVFRQDVAGQSSDPTSPVYVSVKVPPPVVQSPATGTVTTDTEVTLTGRAGGSETALGRLYVAEMDGATGTGPLNPGGWAVIQSGGIFTFTGTLTLGPGKHLLLVYQTKVLDGLYPFVSSATTPTSRVEVDVTPGAPDITTPTPNTTQTGGEITVGGAAGAAVPGADVNVYDGPQVWTTRVIADGSWSLDLILGPGWHDLYATQVINSLLGGGWMESVKSALLSIGIISPASAPVLSLPGNLQFEAPGPTGRLVSFTATATSVVHGHEGTSVAVSCLPMSGSTFAIGDTSVHCTATDPTPGGGTAVGSFRVRIVDGPPVITYPVGGVIAEATDALGAMVSFTVTADDAVSGPSNVTCHPASGSFFQLDNSTTVQCEATDGAGNTTPASFTVNVVDTTAPSIVAPADITVPATGPAGRVVTFAPAVHDLVDGTNVAVVCSPASGSPFSAGTTTTVFCTATDHHDNHSPPVSFHVTVLPLNTPPVVTVPAPIVREATGLQGAVVTFVATATDAQDGPLNPNCVPASGTMFPIATTTVTCTATDSQHATSPPASFTVKVQDTLPPVFSNVPSTITAFATSTAGATVTFVKPTATDAVDGLCTVTCDKLPGAQFPAKKTVVTCTASDSRGHSAPPATFTVWVKYQAPTDGTFFLFPIRANGSSIFRVGRPVPARFRLTGVSAGITNLNAKLIVTKISNNIQGTTEDLSDETVADTDFIFKYRPILKWYAYRWKTTGQTQGTYQLKADLGDEVVHQINISLKGTP